MFPKLSSLSRWVLLLPLLLAICQAATLMHSYGSSWQLVEVEAWKPKIIAWGFPKSLEALKHTLDWKTFEYEPRLTRPLSNLFELFDTPVVAGLWHYAPMPPSVSLTWPFSFILAPLLLFLLLRRIHIELWISVIIVAFYIANPGVMSLEVMLFRPGKTLTNTAILLCLWLAARQENDRQAGHDNYKLCIRFGLLCIITYISLFLDETALILFPALAVLFPLLVFNRTRIISFTVIPVAYLATVKYALPALSAWAGYPVASDYGPQDNITKFLTLGFKAQDYLEVAKGIWPNTRFAVQDSLGLINPSITHSFYYYGIFAIITGTCIFFVVRGTFMLLKQRSIFPADILGDSPAALVWRSLLLLCVSLCYEALLMTVSLTSVIQMRYWGLYYYGVFNVIFLLIFIAALVQAHQIRQVWATIFGIAVVCGNIFIFTATNQVYKDVHYYPHNPLRMLHYFSNEENRFNAPRSDAHLLESKTTDLWESSRTHQPVSDVPLELSFVLYELKILSVPIPCKLHYFNLDWQQDVPQITCHN